MSVFGQQNEKIDSLLEIYESATIDTAKYQALRLLEKEVRRSDRVAALPWMKERVRLSEKIGNDDWMIKSYMTLANNYMYLSKNDSARQYLTLCIDKSRNTGDLHLLIAGLNNSAVLYQRGNNYERAIEEYHQVIVYTDSINDYIGLLLSYGNLSGILMDQGNYKRALEHLVKTQGLHTEIRENAPSEVEEFESYLTGTFTTTALCYTELNQLDSASSYYDMASNYIDKLRDSYSSTYYSSFVKNSMAELEMRKCKEGLNCSVAKWRSILKDVTTGLDGFREIEYDRGVAFSLVDMGKALDGLGRHRSARDTLRKALDLCKSLDFKEEIRECYRVLAENAEHLNEFHTANQYLKNWTGYKDSIRNEERDKFTQQKEVELETFQKENEILQLQLEAEAQAKRQAIQLFIFVLSLLSILGGGYILYTRYKLKKQRELAAFEKQVNIAMSRFVPMAFIRAIGREAITDVELGDQVEKEVTVLFTDIRDFSTISEGMEPKANFEFVKDYAGRMGPIIEAHNGFVNQYLGDGIMAIFESSPNDALDACIEMQSDIVEYNKTLELKGQDPIRVGMGMHTGPLIMGIIGDQVRRDATIISDTVNSASRIESTTKMYKHNILLSGDSYRALGSKEGYDFVLMGDVMVKGKMKPVQVYACSNSD